MTAEERDPPTGDLVLTNRVWPRQTRRFALLLGVLALLGAIGAAIFQPWYFVPLDIGYFAIFLIIHAAMRPLGVPRAQPYLVISRDGLDYGGKQHVPWTSVVSISQSGRFAPRRRTDAVFRLRDWRPSRGLAPRSWSPLSAIDPDWRTTGAVERIQQLAPHVTIQAAS